MKLSLLCLLMLLVTIQSLHAAPSLTLDEALKTALKNHPQIIEAKENLHGAEAKTGQTLANRPRVILADEPTAALDTENGKNVMDLLKKLVVDNNSAIMVVTHDHRMVENFGRILEVSDGRIVGEEKNGGLHS